MKIIKEVNLYKTYYVYICINYLIKKIDYDNSNLNLDLADLLSLKEYGLIIYAN